jgi:hypothetical protein
MARNPFALDPLIGLENPERPLRSRLLQVPEYRERYLKYVHQIAQDDLDWENLGKTVALARNSIERLVELDSRKMSSTQDFLTTTSDEMADPQGFRPSMSLKLFAQRRREYLLNHPAVRDSANR